MLFLKPKSTILPVSQAHVCDVIGTGRSGTDYIIPQASGDNQSILY